MAKRRRPASGRDYPRSARLGELFREILADELERIDDDRLGLIGITDVEVDNELTKAVVYLSALDPEDRDEEVIEVLGEWRGRLQRAIGDQARVRRVPRLEFAFDPAIAAGNRVDAILRQLHEAENGSADD